MKPRILVTRPEPGASRTAAQLAAAGFEPIVLPLTRIEPVGFALPEGPSDAVIVTSAQALQAVETGPLLHLPVFAVGGVTAQSAISAGFGKVMAAGGSLASITALIRNSARPGARLLYLCGRVRRPELESVLGDAGFHLTAVETYDAAPAVYSEDELAARLGETPFAAVTLMSVQAAALFAALPPKFAPLFAVSEIICFSSRISDALDGGKDWRRSVTKEASEDSLMEHLAGRFI